MIGWLFVKVGTVVMTALDLRREWRATQHKSVDLSNASRGEKT